MNNNNKPPNKSKALEMKTSIQLNLLRDRNLLELLFTKKYIIHYMVIKEKSNDF